MSHSQFHCTGRAYLDMHGLIFETSICYWQDQPGRSARSGGWDRRGPPLARSLAHSLARERKPGTGAGRAPRRRGHNLRGEASRTTGASGIGRERVEPRQLTRTHPRDGCTAEAAEGGRGDREAGEGGPEAPAPQTHTPPADGADPERQRAREGDPEPAGEGTGTGGSSAS